MAGVDVFMSFDVFAEFFFPRSNHATCAHMAYTILKQNNPKPEVSNQILFKILLKQAKKENCLRSEYCQAWYYGST